MAPINYSEQETEAFKCQFLMWRFIQFNGFELVFGFIINFWMKFDEDLVFLDNFNRN